MQLRGILIHGKPLKYRIAGQGPVVLLVHGMAGSASTWKQVMPTLAERFTVIAPDLFGHGRSDKSMGDYSLGAFASTLRDLLVALGHSRATVVGQSLGGGVTMQFSYQYPELCERLVLVSTGGLGMEVNPLLRVLTLPGSSLVLSLGSSRPMQKMALAIGRIFFKKKIANSPEVDELWRSYTSLGDKDTRRTFLRTLRGVINTRGQSVSAMDRIHLAAEIPTLVIWGDADPIIPVAHAHAAHAAIEGSWLEIISGVGHYPHCEAPERFSTSLIHFIESTLPAQIRLTHRHVTKAGASQRRAS